MNIIQTSDFCQILFYSCRIFQVSGSSTNIVWVTFNEYLLFNISEQLQGKQGSLTP